MSDGLAEIQSHLLAAALRLVALEADHGGTPVDTTPDDDEEFAGATALMRFLAQKRTKIPAPVEAQSLAKVILAALSAADELGDAIEMGPS